MMSSSIAISSSSSSFLKPRRPSIPTPNPTCRLNSIRLSSCSSKRPLDLSSSSSAVNNGGLVGFGSSPMRWSSAETKKERKDLMVAAAGGSASAEEDGEKEKSAMAQTLLLGSLFGLWYLFNIYFNIYNKQVLKVFTFPVTITTFQFAVGTALVLFMWTFNLYKKPEISGAQLAAILPLAMVHTLGNLFTNMSLGKVAVSFTHTIKAMEPFFSVLLSALFLGEMPTIWVVLSLMPIVGGVALASITEVSFNWAGFWSAMASNVTFQSRNVLSKKLMVKKEKSLDNINLFSIITIMSFVLLFPVALFVEGVKFTPAYLQSAGLNVNDLGMKAIIAGLCFHAYQQASFLHDFTKGISGYTFSGKLCEASGGHCILCALLQDTRLLNQCYWNWDCSCWCLPLLPSEGVEAEAKDSLRYIQRCFCLVEGLYSFLGEL
ncbi:hypothetical protein Sjap_023564 [Stephania japonica]|uniref:Sugar phosphate transporter domain-containing protein n=1 Tax=Stephania japonica TaxID=461633 RepID=A0AAP0HMT8_9MAGN